MDSFQQTTFNNANTGSAAFTVLDSTFLITGVLAALVMLWFCWVTMSAYASFGATKITAKGALFQVFRALFVMVITLVVISY